MKHKILGIIFLVLAAAAIVSGIYYWQTANQTFAPLPIHKDATANWKTYTNTQYGFELKYPSEGKVVGSSVFPNAQELVPQAAIGFEVTALGTTVGIGSSCWKQITLDGKQGYSCIFSSEIGGSYRVVVAPLYIDSKTPSLSTELKITIPITSDSVYNQIFSTFKFTNVSASPSPAAGMGILSGHVTVGPICPVERVGQPCPVPPEAYTSRLVGIFTQNMGMTPGSGQTTAKLIASQHLDANGNYKFDLEPGTYDVKASGMIVNQLTSLEGIVTIKNGEITTLNFSIDTGIR